MRSFRGLVFLTIVVAAQGLTDNQKKKIVPFSNECLPQTGVSQELVKKSLEGKFEEDSKLKQQLLCVFKKIGSTDESGEFIVDRLRNDVKRVSENDKEVDALISKCVVKKNTPEDSVFYAVKCLLKAKPQFSPVE